MQTINDPPALLSAIQAFAVNFGQNLPLVAASPKLQGSPRANFAAFSSGSGVLAICDVAEVLFAYRDEIAEPVAKAAAKTLAAQCAAYAAQPGIQWHGMDIKISDADGAPSRGLGIMWAMQRELGETRVMGLWPSPAADPAPDARFVASSAPVIAPAPTPDLAAAST